MLQRCDGNYDCDDKSDEKDCDQSNKCPSNKYNCGNGLCINATLVCNHKNDCFNDNDEKNCSHSSITKIIFKLNFY